MNCYKLHNISIYSDFEIKDQIDMIKKELGGNDALRKCKHYHIIVKPCEEYSLKEIEGCMRVGFHPLNKNEVWRSIDHSRMIEQGQGLVIIRTSNSCSIFIDNISEVYPYLRSKISEVIRDFMLQYFPFGLHAALIGRDDKLSLIVGDKGAGKTSSVLYAYINGWKVFTDELVLISESCISVLERFPALAPTVRDKFFPNADFRKYRRINGYLNGEDKEILDINLEKCSGFTIANIENIFVLTNSNNKKLIKEKRLDIISRNFLSGKKMSKMQYEIILEIISRSEMLNIGSFLHRVQGDRHG